MTTREGTATTQRRQPFARRVIGVLGCSAIALATAGCQLTKNPYQPTDAADTAKAAAELESLPSVEDTKSQMMGLIQRVGDQISALAPTVAFSWRSEPSRGGCAPPYDQTDGEEILLAKYVSDVPVPEQNWKQVYAIAERAAASVGATGVTVFKDAPDDHDVLFAGDTGTVFRLGSRRAALLTGSTGCRLPAE